MSRTTLSIDTRDGRCEASLFRPESGSGPWPGVILYMDGLGIRPALYEMGQRLATFGYVVLLPDLFYRGGPYVAPDFSMFADPEKRAAWGKQYASTASQANVMSDTSAFLDVLAAQPDVKQGKVGTSGYCMGGGLALAACAFFPERVVAAASFHGSRLATDAPESPHLLAPRLKHARVYVAGAIEDASFPDDMKAKLEAALTEAGVDHEVVTYPARHGWVPTDSPVHDIACTERHWAALAALFDAKLVNAS